MYKPPLVRLLDLPWEIDLDIVIFSVEVQKRIERRIFKKYKEYFDEHPERKGWKYIAGYSCWGYLILGRGARAETMEQSIAHEWLHAILFERIDEKSCHALDEVLFLQRNNPFIKSLIKEGFL